MNDKSDDKVRIVHIQRQASDDSFKGKIDKRHITNLMLLLPIEELDLDFGMVTK
jgi:hypothetical protein